MNLTAPLRRQARESPDAPALICASAIEGVPDGRVYSYAELDRVVDAIAMLAVGWGIAPEAYVALRFRALLPGLLLRLGLARAGIPFGNVAVPGVPSVGIRLHASDAATGKRDIVVEPSWWSEGSDTPAPMSEADDVLYQVQGTSGTTGTPKLVPVTHGMYRARWERIAASTFPRDTRFLSASGTTGHGLGYALRVFDAGGAVVLSGADDDLLPDIERHRVTLLVISPHKVGAMLERRPAGAPRPPSLRQVVLTGSRLTGELLRRASERLCARIECMYGSTEGGPLAAGLADEMPDLDGATGFLLPGVEVEAFDDRGEALPPGELGPLRIRAPGVAARYVGDPEASERAFRDGWYYPNDVGTVTRDRVLVITGRADELINIGGSKYAPETIERVLLGVRGIRDAAAFGIPDALGMHVVHAMIVADGNLDVATLEAAFRHARGAPKPGVVLRVPRIPRNENGKVNRAELVRFVKSMPPRGSGPS